MSTAATEIRYHTPPEIGRRLRVKSEKVIGWIRSGELVAVNVANTGCRRPRYRISSIELEVFLSRRSAGPTPKAPRRRRRDESVIEFY